MVVWLVFIGMCCHLLDKMKSAPQQLQTLVECKTRQMINVNTSVLCDLRCASAQTNCSVRLQPLFLKKSNNTPPLLFFSTWLFLSTSFTADMPAVMFVEFLLTAYQMCSFVLFFSLFHHHRGKETKTLLGGVLSSYCKFSVYVLTGNSLHIEEVPFGGEQRVVKTPHSFLWVERKRVRKWWKWENNGR